MDLERALEEMFDLSLAPLLVIEPCGSKAWQVCVEPVPLFSPQ